jgi:RHS repeat-associated protein
MIVDAQHECAIGANSRLPLQNAVNQYPAINGQSVGYDANGNLTSLQGSADVSSATSMSYDSQNRLLSASDGTHNVTSTYDTRNRVTSRTTDGVTTLFLWDGWNLIEERDLTGAQIRRYVHGAAVDEILIMVDAGGAKYYLHDALGSTTALTDNTGALLESYQYDVFGKVSFFDSTGSAQSASSADNRFLYSGREWIAQAHLYDYRNRVYSPVIGRFMQIDPIRFNAGDVNMYRYVGNSSIIQFDPTGLAPPSWVDLAKNYGPGGTPFCEMNHSGLAKGSLADLQELQRKAMIGISKANSPATLATQQARLMASTGAVRHTVGLGTALTGAAGLGGAATIATTIGTSSVGTAVSVIGAGATAGLVAGAAGIGVAIGEGIKSLPNGSGGTINESLYDASYNALSSIFR